MVYVIQKPFLVNTIGDLIKKKGYFFRLSCYYVCKPIELGEIWP